MTATKIMDIIAKFTDCEGQTSDAVSVYIQITLKDTPRLLKIPKSECPDVWIRLPRHKWRKSWSSMEDPVFPLERKLYDHPLAGLLPERYFQEVLFKLGWGKIPNWQCLFVLWKQGLFLSVYVDDIKMSRKKWNIASICKNWLIILICNNLRRFSITSTCDALNVNAT